MGRDVPGPARRASRLVLSWPNILYPVVGTLLAMVASFLPGISGATLMALALPLTLAWEPLPVVLMFGGLVGGATFMGSVTAILFNVPGTGPSAADPARRSSAGAAGTRRDRAWLRGVASALGSTFGIVVLILLSRSSGRLLLLRAAGVPAAGRVGPDDHRPDLQQGSLGKRAHRCGSGSDACVRRPRSADGGRRFTFGSLTCGTVWRLVPILLGLFSVAEMIDLAVVRPPDHLRQGPAWATCAAACATACSRSCSIPGFCSAARLSAPWSA